MKRSMMDRLIDGIEMLAAIFVGLVAADIFLSVLLRRFFDTAIPDGYDFGRFLLGILIFWGIAATSYRGTHITVDLVWAAAGPRLKRYIDIFATLVLLLVVSVQTTMLFDKVSHTYQDNVLTYDLGSDAVKAGLAKSKFTKQPGFGEKIVGHIMLTYHQDDCWYRNIKIRDLK